MSKSNSLDSEQLTDAMYYILLALCEKRHGYAIMKFIEELTDNAISMGPGTLYTLLKKLMKAKWIVPLDGTERTKVYVISEEGKAILQNDIDRRMRMIQDAKKILEG